MAKSASGKWVSRVGATGGGKAYKKSRPGNYYGALVVIVILGLAATLYARYEYQHPAHVSKGPAPAIGTTWYGGLSIEACGKNLAPLKANPTSTGGFTMLADNVIKIKPVSAADAGKNATLAQFANEYPGLTASSGQLVIPKANGSSNAATTFKNGQACPSTSKYAGQTGQISYAYWTQFGQKKPIITTNPASIKFVEYLRVTMAFEPSGVTPKVPGQTTILAMFNAGQPSVATTTTSPTLRTSTTTTTPKG